MEKKLFDIKKVGRLAKRNLLIVLFAVFICVGVGFSAWLVSRVTSPGDWNVNITHIPSTPTPTLVPDTGWWTGVATPSK